MAERQDRRVGGAGQVFAGETGWGFYAGRVELCYFYESDFGVFDRRELVWDECFAIGSWIPGCSS
jgi:hypothetical protein